MDVAETSVSADAFYSVSTHMHTTSDEGKELQDSVHRHEGPALSTMSDGADLKGMSEYSQHVHLTSTHPSSNFDHAALTPRPSSGVWQPERWTNLHTLRFRIDPTRGLGIQIKGGVGGGASLDASMADHGNASQDLGIFVREVVAGGSAAQTRELAKNDKIVAINGQVLEGLRNEDCMQLLREASARPEIELKIARASPANCFVGEVLDRNRQLAGATSTTSSNNSISVDHDDIDRMGDTLVKGRRARKLPAPPDDSHTYEAEALFYARQPPPPQQLVSRAVSMEPVKEIELPMTLTGLDIEIEGGAESNEPDGVIRVTSVHPSGNAGTDGRLRPGDILLAINGHSFKGLTLAEAAELLSVFKSPRQDLEKVIAVPHCGGSLGISIAGGLGSGQGNMIRIQGIHPESSAAQHGELKPGMVLLSIDSHSLLGVTHSRAVTLLSIAKLRHAGQHIDFRVRTGLASLRFLRPAEGFERTFESKGTLSDLISDLQSQGVAVDVETRARISALLRPDMHGFVSRRAFADAVSTAMGMPPHSRASLSSLQDQPPPAFDDMTGFCSPRNVDRGSIEHELMLERHRRAQADTKAELAHAAQSSARAIEKDYEEIVALLEAEVAHLKAQLIASSDEKDKQLLNFRQRAVVLGVQLNKAVQAKQVHELAVQRLLDFARNTVSLLSDAGQNSRVADRHLNRTPDGRLRFRPSERILPPGAPWAVGDMCRAPRGRESSMHVGVLRSVESRSAGLGSTEPERCVVEFLAVGDVPPALEAKFLSELRPLEDTNFATHALRKKSPGSTSVSALKAGFTFLSPVERVIAKQAAAVLEETQNMLQKNDALPFGWEEAYTQSGEKYFIEDMVVDRAIREVQLERLFLYDPNVQESLLTDQAASRKANMSPKQSSFMSYYPDGQDDGAQSAFDVLGLDGRPLPSGCRPTRMALPGVSNLGEPLFGSLRLRLEQVDSTTAVLSDIPLNRVPPVPAPRRPPSELFEAPGYVRPNRVDDVAPLESGPSARSGYPGCSAGGKAAEVLPPVCLDGAPVKPGGHTEEATEGHQIGLAHAE